MMKATLVSGSYLKMKNISWAWWSMSLIPGLGRQVDVCEFKVSLLYIVSSRTARFT